MGVEKEIASIDAKAINREEKKTKRNETDTEYNNIDRVNSSSICTQTIGVEKKERIVVVIYN